MSAKRPLAAVVLAAGLGTRMNSARAKVLHHLGGRPLISYPLRALRKIGADPIVVVVGYQEEAVRAACEPYGVRFVRQTEQRGTGHAVRMAEQALKGFDGDVLLVNGDLPFLEVASIRKLVRSHQKRQAAVSLLTADIADPSGFGRIVRQGRELAGIVEHKDATEEQRAIREVNVGLYCAEKRYLFAALRKLRPANAQKELYLTDIVAMAVERGLAVASAKGAEYEGAQVSTLVDLAEREREQRARINDRMMRDGVTLIDPATTYIGPDVRIGRDSIIGPNTQLSGETKIGTECRIDGTARIEDSVIGARTHVKLGVMMSRARVGRDAAIGPFAQLRPDSVLADRVHIGNFVETKKATLGEGTKANHLAYLGDAEIGRDTNIGAGTITCNYDGFRKYKTKIGDRVQVGSDTTLVAPLTLGDDAYVATASTVRKDVPQGVLFFNVRRDMHREGWVEARRKQEGKKKRR